jgi:hypothetical protein
LASGGTPAWTGGCRWMPMQQVTVAGDITVNPTTVDVVIGS